MFQDQTVVVFGGSSGIGLATAQAFAQMGAKVIIVGRSQEKLQQAQQQIQAQTQGISVDASDEQAVKTLFEQIQTVDHLVTTTGAGGAGGPLTQVGITGLRQTFEGKLIPQANAVLVGAAFVEPTGSITVVSGAAGRYPVADMGAVGMINVGIEALVPTLARELAPIRVNGVAPGLIKTPAYAGMSEAQRQGMFEATAQMLPVKRVGEAEDVAQAILFLASNRFTTGTIVEVDGGVKVAG